MGRAAATSRPARYPQKDQLQPSTSEITSILKDRG
jgi:hypothetical protein